MNIKQGIIWILFLTLIVAPLSAMMDEDDVEEDDEDSVLTQELEYDDLSSDEELWYMSMHEFQVKVVADVLSKLEFSGFRNRGIFSGFIDDLLCAPSDQVDRIIFTMCLSLEGISYLKGLELNQFMDLCRRFTTDVFLHRDADPAHSSALSSRFRLIITILESFLLKLCDSAEETLAEILIPIKEKESKRYFLQKEEPEIIQRFFDELVDKNIKSHKQRRALKWQIIQLVLNPSEENINQLINYVRRIPSNETDLMYIILSALTNLSSSAKSNFVKLKLKALCWSILRIVLNKKSTSLVLRLNIPARSTESKMESKPEEEKSASSSKPLKRKSSIVSLNPVLLKCENSPAPRRKKPKTQGKGKTKKPHHQKLFSCS